MVSTAFKPAVTRVIEPIARRAVRLRITPDMVTLFGTFGTIVSALVLIPRGDLFIASIVIPLFLLSDLFDGAIARLSDRGATLWGGFLDSTCDRLSDSALLGSLAIYCMFEENPLAPVVLSSIVFGFLVSYVRAKSESYGVSCTVGIAERTERLILSLFAIGLHGLGVPFALAIGVWLLTLLSAITVIQRIVVVRKGLLKNG
jgi:CDP-diacylglycerol---glycerol-3-phosphate 3-phosphatidyltransferase